jgi:hypothetical protein
MRMQVMTVSSLCLLLAATTAVGQIDYRVRPGEPLPGHALDANRMVGSGGFNAPVPGWQPNTASAITSGSVSGLSAFHGIGAGVTGQGSNLLGTNPFQVRGIGTPSGALDANLFRDDLPSAGISYFDRRSVSVGELISRPSANQGFVPGVQPYYAPSETVVDLGGLIQGVNRPGTSMLASPYSAPTTPAFGVTTPTPLPTGVTEPTDVRDVVTDVMSRGAEYGIVQRPDEIWTRQAEANQSTYIGAVQSPLFGPQWPTGMSGVDTSMYYARVGEVAAGEPPMPVMPEPEDISTETATGLAATPWATPDATSIALESGPEFRTDLSTPGALTAEPAATELFDPALRPIGSDVYYDMYTAVARYAEGVDLPTEPVIVPGETAPMEMDIDQAETAPEAAASGSSHVLSMQREGRGGTIDDRRELAARWVADMLSRPVTTFVGGGGDPLNLAMREAEEALHAGKYFRAADRYYYATVIAPDNPLARLGRGHALALAGNYMSAAHELSRGIAMFPDVVSFRLDLPSLVGQKDAFDLRRADLERELSRVESPELRFLLGYLEYFSGLTEYGMKNFERAAAGAPPDSVIAQMPELLRRSREALGQ